MKTMKNKRINLYIRLASLLLAALLCMSCFVSCSGKKVEVKEPVLECDEGAIPLSFYKFLLSRMKGTLAYNGYEVNNAAFWDYIWSTDGATYEDYFNAEILAAAKDMLLRLYLFEEVYDLTLPQSYYDEIDVYMQDLWRTILEIPKMPSTKPWQNTASTWICCVRTT